MSISNCKQAFTQDINQHLGKAFLIKHIQELAKISHRFVGSRHIHLLAPHENKHLSWQLISRIGTSANLKPLLVTSHCALCRKDSLHALMCGFCMSRKGGTGGGEWVICRVKCTWLLGMAVKSSWLGLDISPLILSAWTGLENTTLNLYGIDFWQ